MKPRREAPQPVPRVAAPPLERLLEALGADPTFAESVLGDLAEEFAMRSTRDGVRAAQRWYAREALRTAPHLMRSACRHVRLRTRLRVMALLATGVLSVVVLVAFLLLQWHMGGVGPPVRLTAGTRDTVVVNHVRAVSKDRSCACRLLVRTFTTPAAWRVAPALRSSLHILARVRHTCLVRSHSNGSGSAEATVSDEEAGGHAPSAIQSDGAAAHAENA